MPRVCILLVVLLSIGGSPVTQQSVYSQPPKLVAGRTLDQYAEQLDDEDRVVRLRAVRSLLPFGPEAAPHLAVALEHSDAAMRYLAAESLGQLGGSSLAPSERRLKELADDPQSLAVQLAASFALCRLGQLDEYLPKLTQGLRHPTRGIACSAAELIGMIGPDAASAEPQLLEVLEPRGADSRPVDSHLRGATTNALRKVRGEKS